MAEESTAVSTALPHAPAKVRPLASLAHRDFRLLLAGMPFSSTGLVMRNTANAWQVYEITGSSTLLGLTFLFQGLPSLLMGLFGGTLADMFDRRTLIKVTVTLQLVLAAVLGVLTASGRIEVWHIYAITFAASAIGSAEGPARSALVPKLVPQEHLINASAVQSTIGQSTMLLGPLLAGSVIAAFGVSWTYFLNALLIVPAMVFIWMLRVPDDGQRKRLRLNAGAVFQGLVFTIKTRVLIALLLLDTVTMVFGYYPALMPVFAEEVLEVGAFGLGLLLAAAPLGAMLGFIGLLVMGNIRRKGAVYLLVVGAHAVVLLCFAASPWFILSLVLVALLGFLDSISMAIRQVSFQVLAPDEMRGRVMSIVGIFAISSNSLGGTYLGFVTSFLGARMALGSGALVAGAFTLLTALFWKRVRDFKV